MIRFLQQFLLLILFFRFFQPIQRHADRAFGGLGLHPRPISGKYMSLAEGFAPRIQPQKHRSHRLQAVTLRTGQSRRRKRQIRFHPCRRTRRHGLRHRLGHCGIRIQQLLWDGQKRMLYPIAVADNAAGKYVGAAGYRRNGGGNSSTGAGFCRCNGELPGAEPCDKRFFVTAQPGYTPARCPPRRP